VAALIRPPPFIGIAFGSIARRKAQTSPTAQLLDELALDGYRPLQALS
jgi:hypothetical protein